MTSKMPVAIAAITAAVILAASAGATVADSRIDRVTVYPDRAGVTRIATLDLIAGEHTIVFDNLPVGIDPASLRSSARGPEGIMLLGLNHELVHHLEAPRAKIAELERKIKNIQRNTKEALNARLEVLRQQKELLTAMSHEHAAEMEREGGIGRLDLDTWAAAYDFLSQRLTNVTDSMRLVGNQIEDVDQELALLKAELQQIQSSRGNNSRTVQVDLMLEHAGTVEVELAYTAFGASWSPIYDARLNDAGDAVDLGYFAEVSQKTGEDWDNVQLTLSTAMPSQGMAPGAFQPFYLNVMEQILREEKGARGVAQAPSMADELALGEPEEEFDKDEALRQATNAAARIHAGGFATTFTTVRRETIPADAKAVRAPIAHWTFEGELSLVSRPWFSEGAYRRVKMTNTAEAPLMPGRVAVFAGTDFLGNTAFAKFIAAGGEFHLPFGRDNDIDVERKITESEVGNGRNWLGLGDDDERRIMKTVEIVLSNNGHRARTVTVEEPLPISQDERIDVTIDIIIPEPDEQDKTGKAVWTVELKPGEETTLTYRFKIEHPSDVLLTGI